MNHTFRQFILAVTILASLSIVATPLQAEKVKVAIAGGYEEIDAVSEDRIVYICLSQLVDILGGGLDWEIIGHQVNYITESNRFEFIIGSPFFRLNGKIVNITFPVRYADGRLFISAATFIPFLDQVTQQKISWNNDARVIRIDSEYFNVTDIAFSIKANGLLIELFLTQELAYDIFVTEGNWLNISIRDGIVNGPRILSRRDYRLMYRIKTHQAEGTGQVSIRLKRGVERWHHKLVMDPPRIQISIADINFDLEEADTSPIIGPDNKIDVIVVDAGHGGRDFGAIGSKRTKEKEVTLSIAKELAKLIRKDKLFKVIMTRDRDKFISLDKRAEIANKAGADLYISIHANASPKRSVRGWNVFFLAAAKNDSARAVAQLENSFFLRELSAGGQSSNGPFGDDNDDNYYDPIVSILNEMIMTEFQTESQDFAMMIDREFRRNLKIPARGVDQAAFVVLNKVYTPSVLIEAAFISNKTEEKLLKQKKYQKKVAKSIYKAIKRFKNKYDQK